ncbi:hypothetical protein ACHQM5_022563 [Ranunculus cassubicifolius]
MEAKLNQAHKKILNFSKSTIFQSSIPNTQRFCLEFIHHRKDLLKKRLEGLTIVPLQWKNQYFTKQILVHVVKEGENLTSISRLYGASVQSIVRVNEEIVDRNLVFEGQLINIPVSGISNANKVIWNTGVNCIKARDRCYHSLKILGGHSNHWILSTLPSPRFLPAKTNGYFLVLVPLIAVCIRLIIQAIQHRLHHDLNRKMVNKPNEQHLGSRGIRWKTALNDLREMDTLDSEPGKDFLDPLDDQPVSLEEMSRAYTKIEPAYQKFLAECGMSESGYWRGGSSE